MVMEGGNLCKCLDEIKRSRAEMLIVDLCDQGLELLPDLSTSGITAKVVVLMDHLDSSSYARAFQLGIWGCLSTWQSPVAFQNALNCVAGGERWVPEQSVISDLAVAHEQPAEVPEELTPREWEVLGLVANGFHNKEISARLNISGETAKSHVKSIYRKLKINGRRDAIFRYFEFLRLLDNKGETGKKQSDWPSW